MAEKTGAERRRGAVGYCGSSLGSHASRFKGSGIPSFGKKRKERLGRLVKLWGHNLRELVLILDYNMDCGIRLFRLGSGMFPMADHPRYRDEWEAYLSGEAGEQCRRKVRDYLRRGGRLTLHPGTFVTLGHPSRAVRKRAVAHLGMQATTLDLLGLPRSRFAPINIHPGTGAAGEKSLSRFRDSLDLLDEGAAQRLVFENEDKAFWTWQNIKRCLPGFPVTLDCHHHRINNLGESLSEALRGTRETWKGILPVVHICDGSNSQMDRSHAEWVKEIPRELLRGRGLVSDVEVEAKKKDLAVLFLRAKYNIG